jgi:hypothetical protein
MNFCTSSAARSVRVRLNPVAGACCGMLVMLAPCVREDLCDCPET